MWFDPDIDLKTSHGLLADRPTVFAETGHCCAFDDKEGKSPLEITSKGVRIHLRIKYLEKNCYEAALHCPSVLFPRQATSTVASLYLRKLNWGEEQFARVQCNYLDHLQDGQGSFQTIFIPQQVHEKDVKHILYPKYTIQFRKNFEASSGRSYTLIDMAYDDASLVIPKKGTTPPISEETVKYSTL